MALLPIITAPDPRLKKTAAPVDTVDADIRQLMDDMLETMYAAPGVGLAERSVFEEGCLSLPEHFAEVKRPGRVRVRYLDHENEVREHELDGFLATCIQHEMDHLDGILFVDHISGLKRGIILRKLSKLKKADAKADA